MTDNYEERFTAALAVADAGEKYLLLQTLKKDILQKKTGPFSLIDNITVFGSAALGIGSCLGIAKLATGLGVAATGLAAGAVVLTATGVTVGLAYAGKAIADGIKKKYYSAEVEEAGVLQKLAARIRQEMTAIEKLPNETLAQSARLEDLKKTVEFSFRLQDVFRKEAEKPVAEANAAAPTPPSPAPPPAPAEQPKP